MWALILFPCYETFPSSSKGRQSHPKCIPYAGLLHNFVFIAVGLLEMEAEFFCGAFRIFHFDFNSGRRQSWSRLKHTFFFYGCIYYTEQVWSMWVSCHFPIRVSSTVLSISYFYFFGEKLSWEVFFFFSLLFYSLNFITHLHSTVCVLFIRNDLIPVDKIWIKL